MTLSDDDYFSRNPEFATWLKEERHIFFSSLSSEESRTLFSLFVSAWNSGALPAKYYAGAVSQQAAPRSSHNWGFKGEAAIGRGERRHMEPAA